MSKIKVNRGQFLFLLIDQLELNQSKDIFQSNFKHFDQKTFLEDTQGLNWMSSRSMSSSFAKGY